jgi:hypothetical protein
MPLCFWERCGGIQPQCFRPGRVIYISCPNVVDQVMHTYAVYGQVQSKYLGNMVYTYVSYLPR